MEGADEKMAALKKAYADVLLNTAKESAARILASESKAAGFQRNLAVTKDEAIGTLLRMKSIMDAKINEADTISVGQTRRICELECQLNEAEHTIAFLKTELKRVNDEMEKMKSTPSKELGIQMKGQDTCIEDSHEENKPILLQCCVGSGTADIMPTSDLKSLNDKSQTSGDHCCDSFENSLKLKSRKESYPENNCSGNADLASLLIRRKEPELYRNGCTQRIRALEQNVVTGKGQMNRQFPKTVSVVCKNEKPPNPCLAASCMGNNAVDCSSGPNGTESKIGNYKPDQIGNFQYRYSSRKPRSRPTRTISVSISSKDAADHETSPGHLKDELPKTDINTSDISLCMETMKEIDKDSASPANSALNCVIPTGSNIQNREAQNLLCNREQVVSSSGQNSMEISDVSNCKMGLEMTGVRLEGSDLKDAKVCESNGAPTKVTSDRLLKYTFQRKRMKGSSTNTSEDNHPDKKNTLKRKLSDTMNVPAEPQKPSHIVESSRETRRIAQVARQLISLSEKRW